MRKSSLGRRSSVSQIPIRLSTTGGSSGQKLCSGGRKRSGSLLRQPGYAQAHGSARRSQSEDRESVTGSARLTMVRSNTSGALNSASRAAMTPKTPRQPIETKPSTSTARPNRADGLSTDSNRRMSSFGGAKNRKDPRPIGEKAFQQAAQAKVQQYFDMYGSDVIGAGQSIRPMTTTLFINMVDHLLKYFDARYVITKSNYLEELPNIVRKLGYKQKLDRSWMMTVNTPHSWQHVVALLSWLVDGIECMEVVDPWELMYSSNFEAENDQEQEDLIPIDGKVVTHLKAVYKLRNDPNREAEIERLEDEFIEKIIVDERLTDEDFEVIDTQISLTNQEIQEFEDKYRTQLEQAEGLKDMYESLRKDQEAMEQYVAETDAYVAATQAKMDSLDVEIANLSQILEKKKEDLDKVVDKVKGQSITMEEKEQLTSEKHELLRRIQFHENSIRGYEKSAFTVDLKLAEGVRKLDSMLVDYRTSLAENFVLDPRLKNIDLDMAAFQLNEDVLEKVGENLEYLKEEGKTSLRKLEEEKEKMEIVLAKTNHSIKETEEKIAKEKTLLEGVESDLKQHEQLVAKKTQKLKEEAMCYERETREISEEIAHFDPSKLEEKKIEIGKMEHDLKVLEKRKEQHFSNLLDNFKEEMERLKAPMQKYESAKARLRKLMAERFLLPSEESQK